MVREKSLTLLQALKAEAMMGGSGTKSMAQRSPMPCRKTYCNNGHFLKAQDDVISSSHCLRMPLFPKNQQLVPTNLICTNKFFLKKINNTINLSDLPAIDICSVEVGNVPKAIKVRARCQSGNWNSKPLSAKIWNKGFCKPRVKLGIRFERGAHKSHRGRNLAWTHLRRDFK